MGERAREFFDEHVLTFDEKLLDPDLEGFDEGGSALLGGGRLRPKAYELLSMQAHNVHTMGSDKKRVQFRAPDRLVDRADALATVLGEDRTDVLVTALREYLQEATHDDALTQEIAAAYYDDDISFEELTALLGAEEAANVRVLKRQLDEDYVEELAEL